MDWETVMEKCRAVTTGCFEYPTHVTIRTPAKLTSITAVRDLADCHFVPQEYLRFLSFTDGAFLLPWDEEGVAGVSLLSTSELACAHSLAAATATDGDPRYFVVGQLQSAASDFIAVDAEGAAWWLAQGYGPGDWSRGSGIKRIADSLIDFVGRLADAKGAWWWLPGFESEGT